MDRILITAVGSNDPFSMSLPGEEIKDGPILTLLHHEAFDTIHLLYTSSDIQYLDRAHQVKSEIRSRLPATDVLLNGITVEDPTDYESLYVQMNLISSAIVERYQQSKAELYISLSSGTPQMQTCWLLLVQSSQFPAQMLQVIPPSKTDSGEGAVKHICLDLDRFPAVQKPSILKRKLTACAHRVKSLEAERQSHIQAIHSRLIGEAESFKKVLSIARKVAEFDIPVLITGETGTGKEELARYIHYSCQRKEQPLYPINCSGLTENLIESELFGHKRGAFTGAISDRRGHLEMAGEGTLFLDEIAELPVQTQAKLLRLLEDKKFRRLGESKDREFKGRIISATNRELGLLMEKDAFREDLYHRLNGITLHLPALRDRAEDLPLFINAFLKEFNSKYGKQINLSRKSVAMLNQSAWPGNIRELRKTIERVIILADRPTVGIEHLESLMRTDQPIRGSIRRTTLQVAPFNMTTHLADHENQLIVQAIELHHGNKAAAARHLGMKPHTLRAKYKRSQKNNSNRKR